MNSSVHIGHICYGEEDESFGSVLRGDLKLWAFLRDDLKLWGGEEI